MAIDSKHPRYEDLLPEWTQLRDLKKGERAVKDKGTTYLPPTAGMIEDGMSSGQQGATDYERYKARARVPNFIKRAVEKLVGVMHQKEPSFKLPAVMEPLIERATINGESLAALLRKINAEQILVGRIGLLADFPENPATGEVLPYIATYDAECGINWNEDTKDDVHSLKFVVLDETKHMINEQFNWELQKSFRVLMLNMEGPAPQYQLGVFTDADGSSTTFSPEMMKIPSIRGRTLQELPFVFINSSDVLPEPDDAPLTDLGNLVLAIYRGEADYRQSLYMQGQDTLVVTGGSAEYDEHGVKKEMRIGTGSRIDVDIGGDAKFIGVASTGLSEQRTALENDKKEAEEMSGSLIAPGAGQESGVSLNTRLTARTATLNQIVLTGALGLTKILRVMATWIGANPDEVEVLPNMEFADFDLGGDDLVKIMTAKAQGAPISLESIHAIMLERGITQLSFEDEMALLEEEAAAAFSKAKEDPMNDPTLTDTNANDPNAIDPNAVDPNADV